MTDRLDWLYHRTSGGIRWGLERTEELLAGVEDPHRRFRSIHIGGTNGKGSVAALCDAALRAAEPGRPIGLYTSPHLVSFTERIRIDGVPVSEERLREAAERLRPAIERTGATFFEATTAISFLCFAEAGVELAVVEVGLGGRLDATNVLRPEVSVVTNIGRDHVEYLGDDLAGIAREKAGIFKAGVPAIVGEHDPALRAVLARAAEEAGAPFQALEGRIEVVAVEPGGSGTAVRFRSAAWGEGEIRVPLVGAHQAHNAVLALEALALLPDDLRPSLEAVTRGFASARWPGRLQREEIRGTTYLLDVAHNPAGVAVLAEALDTLELPRPLVLVAGILSDKEWTSMLPPLLERADASILTLPPTAPAGRRWDPSAAATALSAGPWPPPRAIPDLAAALARAATLAPYGTVLVTGSVHTVGDAMAELGIPPV